MEQISEELYENERRNGPQDQWGKGRLRKSDPPGLMDGHGTEIPPKKEWLPSREWSWANPWSVEKSSARDKDGWVYSTGWPDPEGGGGLFSVS